MAAKHRGRLGSWRRWQAFGGLTVLLAATQCVLPHYTDGADPNDDEGSGATAGLGGESSGGAASSGGGAPSDGGGTGSGSTGSGGTPIEPGDPCDTEDAFSCTGTASRNRFVCEGGQWVAGDGCGANELCDTQSGDGDCKAVLDECFGREAGDAFCEGATRKVCGPDLVTVTSEVCDSDDHCTYATTPECAVCLPNQAECEGDTLLRCNDDLTGFDETECTDPEQPCSETAGACTANHCEPEQKNCNGDMLEICSEDLSEFIDFDDCAPGICDLVNLECDVCIAGSASCETPGSRRICDDNGQSSMVVDCETGTCSGEDGSAVCGCPVAPSDCTEEGTVCRAGQLATCEFDVNDCMVTADVDDCPDPRVCSGSLPDASCVCPTVSQCDAANEMSGNYCSGNNLISCSADSESCQEASSTACSSLANEQCFGTHPNANCEVAMGNTENTASNQGVDPNLLFAVPVTVSETVTLRRLGLVAGAAASGVRLMLYTDVAGLPGDLIAGSLTAHTVAAGRNEYPIDYPSPSNLPTLSAGTPYWLAILVEANTSIDSSGTVGARYKTVTGTWPVAPPTPFGASASADLAKISLYLVGRP